MKTILLQLFSYGGFKKNKTMRKRVNEYHFHLVPMVSARQIVKFSYCILELIASVRDWMWNVNARTLIFINVCFQEHVHLTAFSFMNLLCKKKRRYEISLERNVFFFFSKENSIFDWKAVFFISLSPVFHKWKKQWKYNETDNNTSC